MASASLDEARLAELMARLCDVQADVVYFPVRHHSPTCAALVAAWIQEQQPAKVLIEGPSDYNEYLSELALPHELPIAIYSYFRARRSDSLSSSSNDAVADKVLEFDGPESGHLESDEIQRPEHSQTEFHSGVYFPFCEYSPEWVAIQEGFRVQAEVRFIDLPWVASCQDERTSHRYVDAELRRGRYSQALCQKLQVEDFDELWDRMVESQCKIPIEDYFRRVHEYCVATRLWEEQISESDRSREAFMAAQVQEAASSGTGPILVVTGGFHSSAVMVRAEGWNAEFLGIDGPAEGESSARPWEAVEQGITLTPYSYERLDGLTGYSAGMPSPGFYQQAWEWRSQQVEDPGAFEHARLLGQLVEALRQRKQVFSTADLIAVETSARALAAIRGRSHVWRRDLIDAVTTSLIKDELEYGCESPMLDAVHEVLRGNRVGSLATGARTPPLVENIRHTLEQFELLPTRKTATCTLDLLSRQDIQRSRLLHQLQVLDIAGFRMSGGTDFLARDELEQLWESWKIHWTPEFEPTCIEASRYGTDLAQAAIAKLTENARADLRSAASATQLLVQAARCGAETLSDELLASLSGLFLRERQFSELSQALGHLLFLYCFDEAFGTQRLERLNSLLSECFHHTLWLLESIGGSPSSNSKSIDGMQIVAETYQRTRDVLDFDEQDYWKVLGRIQADRKKPAEIRGAASGMLWDAGANTSQEVLAELKYFSDPEKLGDFLRGLFRLAREVVQREPELVHAIDEVLIHLGGEEFQTALPALRLAFTAFTPREKHHLLATLFDSLQQKPMEIDFVDDVDSATAAEALAIEDRMLEWIQKFGLERVDGGF